MSESDSSSGHVVLVGGTAHEWHAMSADEWKTRLTTVVKGTAIAHPRWITLMPHSGPCLSDNEFADWNVLFHHEVKTTLVTTHGWSRNVYNTDDGVSVIVDPCADGHVRFAAILENLRTEISDRMSISVDDLAEEDLAKMMLAPATAEPDLVVVLGPANRLPTSMAWELGYSELVFLDLAWADLNVSHLEIAVDDFHRRQRRFGGLDS